jgi:hypothetical protein
MPSMTPFKRLVNPHEELALRELEGLGSEFGYRIHPKIRLADVLPVDAKQIRPDLLSFALKAHFDFTAYTSDHRPLFAVEFDGHFHQQPKQMARDAKKDELCALFDFPLLRINSNHLLRHYNKQSLLRWVISAWELQNAFVDAQKKGTVPADEDFDPIWLHHHGTTIEEVHPHWISLRARLEMQKLHKQGTLPYMTSCGLIFTDENDNYRGIEWVDVAEDAVVSVESAMKKQNFPLYLGELFGELLFVLVHEKLIKYLKTGQGAISPRHVEKQLNDYGSSFRFASSHTGPTKVKAALTSNGGKLTWTTGVR